MKKTNIKIVVIVGIILLVLIVGMFFILNNDKEVKKISCNFSNTNYSLVSYDVEIDAKYTSPVSIDSMEGTIEFTLNNKELLSNIDYIEDSIKEYYKKLEKSKAINIDVSRLGNNLVVKYEIDYTNYDASVLNKQDFIIPNNSSFEEIPSVESLRESISKAGGVCVEE